MKNKFVLSILGVFISITSLVMTTILFEETIIDVNFAILITIISLCSLVISLIFAIKIDYETSDYKCKNCNHIFKPKFTAYLFGAHTLTTRYLRCPNCGKTTWCNRIGKEN